MPRSSLVPLGLHELLPRTLPSGGLPVPEHIVVVVEENHGLAQIRGNPDAAYLNALADGPHAALLAQSYAIEHPSQPNYLDLFSGSNQGVTTDGVPAGPFATPNLGASLRAAGRTFVGYSEGLPAAGSLAGNAGGPGGYWRKHNPWADWQGGGANGLPAEANQPFAAFPADYTQLPTVAFVVPDQANDMHDGTVATADGWLRDHLGGYAAWAVGHNSLLVVTFDEDDDSTGNHIFTLLVGAGVAGGEDAGRVDHFGLLRTIEDLYGLPAIGASAAATPADVWTPAAGGAAFAVGTDAGGGSAELVRADGTITAAVVPFGAFTGGVRVATADFNGDGVADLIVGTGPGGPTHVRILDGVTQAELFAVDPFEAGFTGGVYVAAGDLTGDGVPELVVTPDEGGGPRVRVFDGRGFGGVDDFLGIDDPAFRGGARAAVGDMTGDGTGDLVVAAGFGGGPRVAAFDGPSLGGEHKKLFNDFFAFEPTLRNGVYVTAGDINGDGYAELIAGGGPGGGPRVTAFDGRQLMGDVRVPVANFFGGDAANRGGVRVAVKSLDADAKADLLVGAGTGVGSRVTAYPGAGLAQGGAGASLDFDAFAGFNGGVFVG